METSEKAFNVMHWCTDTVSKQHYWVIKHQYSLAKQRYWLVGRVSLTGVFTDGSRFVYLDLLPLASRKESIGSSVLVSWARALCLR